MTRRRRQPVLPAAVEPRVVEFVADWCGVPAETISLGTTLLGDLGVDADDAVELLEWFSSRFSVDLDGLSMQRHFGPEGLPCWVLLSWLRYARKRGSAESRAGLVPVCVGDLVEAARAGRWTASANPPTGRATTPTAAPARRPAAEGTAYDRAGAISGDTRVSTRTAHP